jgi:cation transport protein ChaC
MLSGKIIDPEKSTFRVSLATFEDWDRRAAEAGYGQNWRRSHEDREATRSTALAGRLNDDLWVFAYGSLMWDPAIHIVEIRRATLQSFHRSFCLMAEIGRGSKEAPALMAALDVGGECHGVPDTSQRGEPRDRNPMDEGDDRGSVHAFVPDRDYSAGMG